MGWTAVEARWRDAILAVVLPVPGVWPAPPADWDRFDRAATPLLRFGFRFAVWWWVLVPLLRAGAPLHRLPADRQAQVLDRAWASDWFITRQVVLVTKTVASLLAFRGPAGAL